MDSEILRNRCSKINFLGPYFGISSQKHNILTEFAVSSFRYILMDYHDNLEGRMYHRHPDLCQIFIAVHTYIKQNKTKIPEFANVIGHAVAIY